MVKRVIITFPLIMLIGLVIGLFFNVDPLITTLAGGIIGLCFDIGDLLDK